MNCLKCFLNFTEKRIDYAKAEEGLKTTPNSECALNALYYTDVDRCGRFVGFFKGHFSPHSVLSSGNI